MPFITPFCYPLQRIRWNFKTTDYLHMKAVLDSIVFQMLRRGDDMLNTHSFLTDWYSDCVLCWSSPRNLCFLTVSPPSAPKRPWNPKHPSYVSTWLLCNSFTTNWFYQTGFYFIHYCCSILIPRWLPTKRIDISHFFCETSK